MLSFEQHLTPLNWIKIYPNKLERKAVVVTRLLLNFSLCVVALVVNLFQCTIQYKQMKLRDTTKQGTKYKL